MDLRALELKSWDLRQDILDIIMEESDEADEQKQREEVYRKKVISAFFEYGKIKFLCENLWSEELEENFKIHITTNGTLIHGEVQDWLRKHKDRLALKLSLDGDKISNDQNRPKSYDLIDIPFF